MYNHVAARVFEMVGSKECYSLSGSVLFRVAKTLEILNCKYTSHSAYVATETESDGAKIDGLLPPNFL